MGIIMSFAKGRIEEVKGEIEKLRHNPLSYILEKQPIRKIILLEYLDYVRPVVGTKWEHTVEQWRKPGH